MARFAFIVPPLTGHVNPTLSLGTELLSRGHEVGWISLDPTLGDKLPAGGQLLLVTHEEDSREYLDQITKKNVSGIESIKFLYEEVLIPLNRFMYAGINRILDSFNPDAVINDHQLFAGAIAAYNRNLPYATSVTAPAAIKMVEDLPGVHDWEVKQIVGLQQELGIAGDAPIVLSDKLTLVYTSKDFFGHMDTPDHYKFIGPVFNNRHIVPPFNWEKLSQRGIQPRVLVSIGTTFDHAYKKEFFGKVIAALGGEEMTVIVVSDESLFDTWPDNFIVQPRVPQLDLLPHLDGVVCHGGHNTVCETLSHGLPLVVIPIAYDQSHVAGQVVQAESGIRLNFKRFKATHLKEAVWGILQNPAYREAAQRIQDSFERAGGAAAAADQLEDLTTVIPPYGMTMSQAFYRNKVY